MSSFSIEVHPIRWSPFSSESGYFCLWASLAPCNTSAPSFLNVVAGSPGKTRDRHSRLRHWGVTACSPTRQSLYVNETTTPHSHQSSLPSGNSHHPTPRTAPLPQHRPL